MKRKSFTFSKLIGLIVFIVAAAGITYLLSFNPTKGIF